MRFGEFFFFFIDCVSFLMWRDLCLPPYWHKLVDTRVTFWMWKGGAIRLDMKTVLSRFSPVHSCCLSVCKHYPKRFHSIVHFFSLQNHKRSAEKHPKSVSFNFRDYNMRVMLIMSSLRIMLRRFSRAALRTHKHLWKSHIISLLLETLMKKQLCKWKKMWLNLIKMIPGRVGQMVCFGPYRNLADVL